VKENPFKNLNLPRTVKDLQGIEEAEKENIQQYANEASSSKEASQSELNQEEYIISLEKVNKSLSEENYKLNQELKELKKILKESKTSKKEGNMKYLEDKCKKLEEMCEYWKHQATLQHKKTKPSIHNKKSLKKMQDEMEKLEQHVVSEVQESTVRTKGSKSERTQGKTSREKSTLKVKRKIKVTKS